jgi:hypothetical protein
MGFGLEIEFSDHLNTCLATTLNYSTITNHHTVKITTAHVKSFQHAAFISHSKAMVPNSRDPSASALTSLPTGSQMHWLSLLFTDFLITLPPIVLLKTPRHGPCRICHFQQFLCYCTWPCCHGNLLVLWLLPSNGSKCYNINDTPQIPDV